MWTFTWDSKTELSVSVCCSKSNSRRWNGSRHSGKVITDQFSFTEFSRWGVGQVEQGRFAKGRVYWTVITHSEHWPTNNRCGKLTSVQLQVLTHTWKHLDPFRLIYWVFLCLQVNQGHCDLSQIERVCVRLTSMWGPGVICRERTSSVFSSSLVLFWLLTSV